MPTPSTLSPQACARRKIVDDGPYGVVDHSGRLLPGRWATEDDAIEHGLCGLYLLSGGDVVEVIDLIAPST